MSQTIAPSPPSTIALPPGPRAPAWWQLVRFAGDPLGLLDECHRRFGDAFTLHIAGNGRFVMLSDPEVVREVFRGDPEVLHSGEGNSIFIATVGRSSVLVLDEAPHARQRRALVPPLKGERMRAFFDAMRLETLEAVRAWPRDAPFAALPTMRRITLRVILRTALGLAPGPELDRFERKIETLLSQGRQRYALVLMTIVPIERLSGSRWAPLFRQMSDLDDDLFALIAARRRGEHSPSGENVLDDLLAATHEDGTPLGDREVRDAIFTILIAGHDTTALALAWALAEIADRSDVVDRLADELRRVTGGGPPEAEHLPALEYLDGAIRESLRLRPVAPFVVRKTVRPYAVGGREYPPGVILCPCSYLVHRREDLYPEPDRFRPERFLERKFGPHEWFPFGGGNRVCLGMPFALYEMKVLLATLLSQVRPSRPAGARSRARRYGIVLGPDDGARIIVRGSAPLVSAHRLEQIVRPAGGYPDPNPSRGRNISEGQYEGLIGRLRESMRTAWLPVTEAGDGPVTASKFSGIPWLGPGEPWPVCPRCGAPMVLFLQLDLATLPGEIGGELGAGLLQMFYCVSRHECTRRGEGCLEPFSPYQLLRRVSPYTGGPPPVLPKFDHVIPARRIIGWQPVEDYPDRTEWADLGFEADDDAADAMGDLGYQPRQSDKLLGWPSWPQYVDYPRCRVCRRELWLVFQLESDQNLQYMFGDGGCGHITCCPDHPEELAFQWQSY